MIKPTPGSEKERLDALYCYINSTCPISQRSWESICSILVLKKAQKGERLLDYMHVENSIRFLTHGIVKCEDHFNSQSFVYDFRVAPIILSETFSFFNNTPSRITLEAITDCEFIDLPRFAMTNIIFSNLDLAKFATIGTANYLGLMHYKHALLRTLDASQRYKHFLREYPNVAFFAKLSDIASYIGITQQSLSRLRRSITWNDNEYDLQTLSNELDVISATQGRPINRYSAFR